MASILVTGFVCVVYTCIGGAKTVIWTNVYQFLLIVGETRYIADFCSVYRNRKYFSDNFCLGGLGLVVATGLYHVGGLGNVIKISMEGERIDFSDFRIDPTVRHSFWSLMIGGTFTLLTLYAANQMTVQRWEIFVFFGQYSLEIRIFVLI